MSIVVLISGNGSNLQALIDANFDIKLVVSNRKAAYGLTRAAVAGIPVLLHQLKPYTDQAKSRQVYDSDLADKILNAVPGVKLVVLAGWMHILSKCFLDKFSNVINLHPALPGAFDGANAIKRSFEAFRRGEITSAGVMVHRVIPEVDRGEVIVSIKVEILEKDSMEDLEERIHLVEHEIIVEAVRRILI
jgi:formyltetrahydrofolate-dependent phosphoribosylglycinamide formyltransferase